MWSDLMKDKNRISWKHENYSFETGLSIYVLWKFNRPEYCKQFPVKIRKIKLEANHGCNNLVRKLVYRKVAFLMYTEMVNFRPQSWKAASRNKNHTEDWELGCHPRDNGHVTH